MGGRLEHSRFELTQRRQSTDMQGSRFLVSVQQRSSDRHQSALHAAPCIQVTVSACVSALTFACGVLSAGAVRNMVGTTQDRNNKVRCCAGSLSLDGGQA